MISKNNNLYTSVRMLITVCFAAGFTLYSSSLSNLSAQSQTFDTFDTINDNADTRASNISSTATFETFFARGVISSLIVDKDIVNMSPLTLEENPLVPSVQYIVAGNWSLDVTDQQLKNFQINFTMVHPDGSDWHYHEISNFQLDPDIPILLDEKGTTFVGMTDIGEDDMDKWFGVQSTVSISNLNTISILLDPADTENHFNGQPIYGIVLSLNDKNGSLISSS